MAEEGEGLNLNQEKTSSNQGLDNRDPVVKEIIAKKLSKLTKLLGILGRRKSMVTDETEEQSTGSVIDSITTAEGTVSEVVGAQAASKKSELTPERYKEIINKTWLTLDEYHKIFDANNGIETQKLEGHLWDNPETLEQVHETLAALFKAEKPIFIRWTPSIEEDIARGYSKHLNGETIETGISVNRLLQGHLRDYAGTVIANRIDLAMTLSDFNFRYDRTRFQIGFPEARIYLLTGKQTGIGSDNEPLLDPKSIEVMAEVDRSLMPEASAITNSAYYEGYPYFDDKTVKDRRDERKSSIELDYRTGKEVPQSILDEFPDIELNESFREQREFSLRQKSGQSS